MERILLMKKFFSCCVHLLETEVVRSSLIKVGFILLSALVISLSTVGPELYDRELEAYKLKFETEFHMNQLTFPPNLRP